jgi:tetratricopeptide (TPR) repeat protein
VETVRLSVQARNIDRMLDALRSIVDTQPQRMAAAFEALGEARFQFRGNDEATRRNAERMRQIVADARTRLPDLPREEAARAERQFVPIDAELSLDRQRTWSTGIARVVEQYRGTEAAVLAELDLIGSGGVSQQMLDRLDAFIEQHPGTTAAAKALYQKGFQWHTVNAIGTLEPRGADPTPRLRRVLAIVKELESGRYPPSEWVDKAPSLVIGFFAPSDAKIAPENIDVMLAGYQEFARSHFTIDDEQPMGNGIGYVITSKMGDLFEKKGDRIAGVERVLDELERDAPDPAAVRYLRAVFQMQAAARPSADREALTARARQDLTALAGEGRELYHRKALATLAALEFELEEFAAAREAFRRYVTSYPQGGWAWVAALRIGQCEERLGNPQAAAAAYLAAADRYADTPIARVLGHEYAARAYEAAGVFDKALASHQRALDGWDNTFGLRYTTYIRRSPKPGDPFVPSTDLAEVTKESLAPRIAQLKTSLGAPGGVPLERGRSLLVDGRHQEAAAELERMIAEHPRSPLAPAARALAHRARLERALQLADVDQPGGNEVEALKEFEALAREPVDFAVTAARIAQASILWKRGEAPDAEKIMKAALTAWHAQQRPSVPAAGLETDVAEIRRTVFLPKGGAIYESGRWNAFRWPATAAPFALVNADVRVKLHDGDITRVTLVQTFPGIENALFFDTDQIALLEQIVTRLGGTRRREPRQIMETPNQPVGDSMQILKLWNAFFPARPGHWGGWEIETYPVITEIQFTNAERTKASARVTIGYSGATVELEKEAGTWVAKRLTNQWVT